MKFSDFLIVIILIEVQGIEIDDKSCSGCFQDNSASKRCESPICSNIENCLKNSEFKNLRFTMLCRETNQIAFTWAKTNNTFYIIKYHKYESMKRLFSSKTTCPKILIRNLTQDQLYNFQLFAAPITSKTLFKCKVIQGRTASFKEEKSTVQNLSYSVKYTGGLKNDLTVQWSMGKDYSCYYVVMLSYENADEGGYAVRKEVDLSKTKKPEYTFKHLDFGKTYEVSVASFAPYRADSEGPKEFLHITIPTCADTLKNLTVCVPNPPENLTLIAVENTNSTGRNYLSDLKVSWDLPDLPPDYYLVSYALPKQDGGYVTRFGNISGANNSYTFKDVNVTGCFIQIIAHSRAGNSTTVGQKCNNNLSKTSKKGLKDVWKWIFIFGVASLTSLVFFVVYKFVFKQVLTKLCPVKKTRPDTSDKIWEPDSDYQDYKSKWELIESKLIVDKIIGSGAFGLVQKGFYYSEDNSRTPVAVKTLKAKPTPDQIAQFYAEIEIMKSVPKHAHIVYLIGVITKNRLNNPLMLVEYCSKGDLLNFLREIGKNIANKQKIVSEDRNEIFNANYDVPLQPRDLLSFARQIAVGMEFLSNLKIVHRDLAARNVLVSEDLILKISDFGLSRDVYMDDMYRKVTGGKLPFKWLALESLTHQIYTTESDVWSFGIVLWEIVTLGANPYPMVKPENLIAALRDGYRMEKPLNCSDELYEIMLLCWQASPNLRPTFKALKLIFDKILESQMQYVTLDITKKANLYENQFSKENSNKTNRTYKNI